jgi:hypothetical protein
MKKILIQASKFDIMMTNHISQTIGAKKFNGTLIVFK